MPERASVVGSKSGKVLGSFIKSGKALVDRSLDFCRLLRTICDPPPEFTLAIKPGSGGNNLIYGST
jgi:hypothetical protein